MSFSRSILYLGERPTDSFGSARIVGRHLKRLRDHGSAIVAVLPPGSRPSQDLHPSIVLPHRESWWPPYRESSLLLRFLREHLWARWAKRQLRERPDVILSYLAFFDPTPAAVAIKLGKRLGIPVALIVHDDPDAFGADERRCRGVSSIARAADLVLPVTRELGAAIGIPTAEPLLPIPAAPGSKVAFEGATPTRLLFAGNLHPGHVPVLVAAAERLASRGAELVVIAPPGSARESMRGSRALVRDPFPTSTEALAFAAMSCHGALVSYGETVQGLPMARSSFPSKWMDFANAGVPCVLVLPEGSAVGRWASGRGWESMTTLPDWSGFDAFIDRVSKPDGRSAEAERCSVFAKQHFDPEAIHARLERALEGLVARSNRS